MRQNRGRASVLSHRSDGQTRQQRRGHVIRSIRHGGARGSLGLVPSARRKQPHRSGQKFRWRHRRSSAESARMTVEG
jgi:hypothetical protein